MYVVGRPRLFLQLEGAVLFCASLFLFSSTHQHWWWVPALLFVPDIFMVGYARSTQLGALIYNIGMDRILGYGLKYDDHFKHTHLGDFAAK